MMYICQETRLHREREGLGRNRTFSLSQEQKEEALKVANIHRTGNSALPIRSFLLLSLA